MITFKEYLLEASSNEKISFEKLMHGDCAAFYQQSKQKGLLIRGISGYGTLEGTLVFDNPELSQKGVKFTLFRKTVRKDRYPMDTVKEIHTILDDWFEEEMGTRARSQALFVFGESGREAASEYGGGLCVVLPIGAFHYVWSPKVKDLYDDVIRGKVQTTPRPGNKATIDPAYIGSDGKPDLEKFDKLMKGLGYTINGFDKAVESTSEIMIDCNEFYVIPLAQDEEHRELQIAVLKKAFVQA